MPSKTRDRRMQLRQVKELGPLKGSPMLASTTSVQLQIINPQGYAMHQTTKHQLLALVVVLQTLVGASVVASLESSAGIIHHGSKLVKAQPPSMNGEAAKEPPYDKSVLRNSFSMLWLAGGAVLGAYVCTALRQALNFSDGPKTFGVAMAFSIPLSAFILHQYFDNRPEYCFFAGSCFSMASWFIIEILIALQQKWKKTAAEKGLAGLRQELSGTATTQDDRPPKAPGAN